MLAGCEGLIGDSAPSRGVVITDPEGTVIEITPAPRTMWRLTVEQYENTIEDVFGAEVAASPIDLPADPAGETFESFGAATIASSARDVEIYHAAALDLGARVWGARESIDGLAGCAPASASDPCVRGAIERIGRRLFRRPLTSDELARYVAIVETAETHPDAAEVGAADAVALGLQYAIAALLDSPSFLYVAQEGELDPATGARRYTSLEMASRLSYFMWSSSPDDALLDRAIAGELVDDAALEAEVTRMLETERGRELAVRFFMENWKVSHLPEALKEPAVFPEWSPAIAPAAMDEFARMVRDVASSDRSVLDLFSGRRGYANDALGALYGVEVAGSELVAVELGEERSGALTSIAVLASNALPNRTSPTYRGVFVRSHLLCEPVPAPPGDVPQLEETGASVREQLERHQTDPVCAGCHTFFDPLGMPLENFDALGRYRTMDGEDPIDPSADFEDTRFEGVHDLAEFLRSDPRASACVTYWLYADAMGHFPTVGERELVASIGRSFTAEGSVFRDAVVRVVTSPGFRYFSEE